MNLNILIMHFLEVEFIQSLLISVYRAINISVMSYWIMQTELNIFLNFNIQCYQNIHKTFSFVLLVGLVEC